MSKTIEQAIEFGKQACVEHGFGFIEIYRTCDEAIDAGWDRFIILPVHVSNNIYEYIGLVRKDGSFELPYYKKEKSCTDGMT